MVYPFGKLILPPVYKLWLRKADGMENAPKDKPFIIATNHTSYYDSVIIHSILIPKINKKIHTLVNSRYWNNFATRTMLDWGECIPVYIQNEKNSKEKNKKAFKKALDYIKKGDIVQIFPEGHRSIDGKLQKGKTGVARLALKAKVPVVPAGIIGSNSVIPKGKILPRFARCEVKIGKPMYFKKYYNKKSTKKMLEEVTRSIMKEIAKLINQEYNY